MLFDVPFRKLDPKAIVPIYAHEDDAGMDLSALEAVELPVGERRLIRTGIAIALPIGYAGFVHPRSGLAHRQGVTVANAPGTIDSGYRGEIMVNLINHGDMTVVLLPEARIAQLVIQRVESAQLIPFEGTEQQFLDLNESRRGIAGHGSTG